MHGIRLDSDVEDTPDKRDRPQIQNTGGRAFRTNRGSTDGNTEQEKTISPGKQLLAVEAVRRSRLRLATKGSASTKAPLPGVGHPPPSSVPSLPLVGKEGDAASAQLPNPAQQELAVTPQRPMSLPERPQRISAKPKEKGKSPPRAPEDMGCPPRASGEPQTELQEQQQSKDAPPPNAHAQAHADGLPAAAAATAGAMAAADGALGSGSGPAAGPPSKKPVRAKLDFFAPQVRRSSKSAVVKVQPSPDIVQTPSTMQLAVVTDSVRVEPSNPPTPRQPQQPLQEGEVKMEGEMVEEESEKDLGGFFPQPQEPLAVVALVSEAPSSHNGDQEATALPEEKGPAPGLVVQRTEYVSLHLRETEGTAAESIAVGGAATTANGTANGAPCAAAGDVDASVLTADVIVLQQQHSQPPPPYSGSNGFGAWQDHGRATRRLASRACRQVLLPGAPPPSAVATTGKAAPSVAPAVPVADAAEMDATAGPQAGNVRLAVRGRRRGSRAWEAGSAAVVGGGTCRGRGAAERARRDGRGICDDKAAPKPTVVLSDGTASSADGGDVYEAEEEEYHPTGQRRSQRLSGGGSVRGRDRGNRGGARGRGHQADGRGRRGRGSAAAAAAAVPPQRPDRNAGGGDSLGILPAEMGAQLRGKLEAPDTHGVAIHHHHQQQQQQQQGDGDGETAAVYVQEHAAAAAGADAPNPGWASEGPRENRPEAVSEAAATSDGCAGPPQPPVTAKPAGCVSEMFLSVAERKRRQKQRQDEEAAAQRQAAEEREQREREETEQRVAAAAAAVERERERERGRKKSGAQPENGDVESIDLSASPPRPRAPPPAAPVNPFFRIRKRPEPPAAAAAAACETGGAAKRLANGGVGAAGGGGGGGSCRLLPALAPIHVRQTANDCAAGAIGSIGAGGGAAVPVAAAAAGCLLQIDGDGTLSLVPSRDAPSLPAARLLDFATTAAAVDVKHAEGTCCPLRFSFVRRTSVPSAASMPPYRQLQGGPQDLQAVVMHGGGGGGGSSSVPLLTELATYLAETQRRDCIGGATEGNVEVELMDLPTAEEVLRQLTDELNLRRRRIALQPPQPPSQDQDQNQAQPHPAEGPSATPAAMAGAAARLASGEAVAAVALPHGAPVGDQLWCTAHQPRCVAELCGNAEQVGRLRDWLQSWREVIMQEGQRAAEGATGGGGGGGGGRNQRQQQRRLGRRRYGDDGSSESCFTDSDFEARSAGGTADSDGEGPGGGGGGAQHKGLPTAMVLRGPSGCGKTAAAYAVASELGFRVLEVNPSLDRSGPQLLRMVGEATKSRRLVHGLATIGGGSGGGGMLLSAKGATATIGAATAAATAAVAAAKDRRRGREVGAGRRGGGVTGAAGGGGGGGGGRRVSKRTVSPDDSSASAMSSPSPSPVKHRRGCGTGRRGGATAAAMARLFSAKDAAPTAVDSGATAGDASGVSTTARGSSGASMTLMLFDEVDVLPEEDKGFMGALVSIIQQSKRPIILTAGPGGQLSPALRALGLQELSFQPASETQLLRTVAMVCAASRNCSSSRSSSSNCDPSGKPAAATPQPCVMRIKTPTGSAVLSEHEVLDLSGDGDAADADIDGADVSVDGFRRNDVMHPGWLPPQQQQQQRQQRQQLLLPSLLHLVRGCHGDLRRALLEVQFWLGGNGGGNDGGRDSATAAAARLRMPYWGGQGNGQLPTILSGGSAANDRNGDNLEAEYDRVLDAAWQAVQGFITAAATAAVASVSAPSADVGACAAAAFESEDTSDCFAAVLPSVRLWLPKLPGSTAAVTAASAATLISAPTPTPTRTPASEPQPPEEDAPVRGPAERRLQWQLYEEKCKRVREQQLAARWLELEVARAATRISRRRKLGFGGRFLPAEAEVEAEIEAEPGVEEGNGVADDATFRFEEAVEAVEAVEAMGASAEDSCAVERAVPISQIAELTGQEDEGTPASALRGRRETTTEAETHGIMQQQQQWDREGGEENDERGVKMRDETLKHIHHNHQHFPKKRRASEAVEGDKEAGGDDSGNAAAGQSGGGGGGGGGVKRSRMSLSSSLPASRAVTPRDSSTTTTTAADAAAAELTAADAAAAVLAAADAAAATAAAKRTAVCGSGSATACCVEPMKIEVEDGQGGSGGGDAGNADVAAAAGIAAMAVCGAVLDMAVGPPSLQPAEPAAGTRLAPSSLAWLPAPPDPLPYNTEALTVLAAAPPSSTRRTVCGGTTSPRLEPESLQAAVRACRVQAALADMYDTVSELSVLAMPRDAFIPVSGACALRHHATYASVRPMGLGTNMALQPPIQYGSTDKMTSWVMADAVRDQEDMPGRLLSVWAAEVEAAGFGAGEQVGTVHQRCAAAAAASAVRLAAQIHAPKPTPPSLPCYYNDHRLSHPTAWHLSTAHSVLQVAAPGSAASGAVAALDRAAALMSICRSEATRQQREARRSKWIRRPPIFCHYLASLESPRLAALHRLAAAFPTPAEAAEAEAVHVGGDEGRDEGEAVRQAGNRMRRRGW